MERSRIDKAGAQSCKNPGAVVLNRIALVQGKGAAESAAFQRTPVTSVRRRTYRYNMNVDWSYCDCLGEELEQCNDAQRAARVSQLADRRIQ